MASAGRACNWEQGEWAGPFGVRSRRSRNGAARSHLVSQDRPQSCRLVRSSERQMTASTESGVHPACFQADVAELADAPDLGSGDRKVVGVQISPSALRMMNNTLARWGQAPDWLSLAEAAQLMGPDYDVDRIAALVASATVVAQCDRVGKISLARHQESIWTQQVETRKRRTRV